jgi:hypothetical protein
MLESDAHLGEDKAARAARYSDLFGAERPQHTSDCAYCPICATIGVVRKTKPEVLEHLTVAARELVAAAMILLEEADKVLGAEPRSADETGETDNVRRIV